MKKASCIRTMFGGTRISAGSYFIGLKRASFKRAADNHKNRVTSVGSIAAF